MNEIVLAAPTMEFAKAIMDFRRELLAENGTFDGCSKLEHYARAEDWLDLFAGSPPRRPVPRAA